MTKLKNIYVRNTVLILGALVLTFSYESQLQNYIQEVINPIVLIRTFHMLLFVSIFWIFYKSHSLIYKLIELMTTLLIFNGVVFLASPLHSAVVEMVTELSKIPDITNFLGADFISLMNNRYFGYSSCFIACLGVLRIALFGLINQILIQTLMHSTEYVYTCKSCNAIVNKSEQK